MKNAPLPSNDPREVGRAHDPPQRQVPRQRSLNPPRKHVTVIPNDSTKCSQGHLKAGGDLAGRRRNTSAGSVVATPKA
jgi:hypothetical protein